MDFKREYLGQWADPSELERNLDSLAEEYYRRTEAYDLEVCTGATVRGAIMPANDTQFMLINHNARLIQGEMEARVLASGGTRKEWREALQACRKRRSKL